MSEPPAVEARSVGVRYILEHERALSLKAAALRLFRESVHYEPFWALRGVSFAVPRGSAFGIVGRNGSGKSTLLRAVAGILAPTEGEVRCQGQVLPLIELGAGTVPELSALDNVRLLGALYGLRRDALRALVPSILEFAELEAFGDVPLRCYSSGMSARLSFSLAVHLPADILLIDEVLAVGDEDFKQRSRERLDERIHAGVTVVLVSHDLASVERLCPNALLLEHGSPQLVGPTSDVVSRFREMRRARANRRAADASPPVTATPPGSGDTTPTRSATETSG